MTKYGNSGGRNKGKKYKKLNGFEQATPESEAKACDFMKWYGDNVIRLKAKINLYDDEVATDTAIYLYDCIALKNLTIQDYEGYFLRAYYTTRLAVIKKQSPDISIDERAIHLSASDFNYEVYEKVVDEFNTEIMDYVRDNYEPIGASLFEIYIGLQPDISYDRLATMLNIKRHEVWRSIGAIRKDLCTKFGERKGFLLSHI